MATIKVTCTVCGDIELNEHGVSVTVAEIAEWATYTFECNRCHERYNRPAAEEVIGLLRSAGCSVDLVPEEAQEIHDGPVITHDDILDFAMNFHHYVALLNRS